MTIPSHIVSRLILFTLFVMIIPMIIYPAMLGSDFLKFSIWNIVIELSIYAAIIFISHRHLEIGAVIKAAGFCLVFRLILAVAFGLLISVMYAMGVMVSLTLSVSSYLPAIVLHVLATPFILFPVISQFGDDEAGLRSRRTDISRSSRKSTGKTTVAISKSNIAGLEPLEAKPIEKVTWKSGGTPAGASLSTGAELNGFEKAMRYIGEDGAVYFAGVVDSDGLLVANFKRRDAVPEDWAPLALLLFDNNSSVMHRGNLGIPSKIDLSLENKRVVVDRLGKFYLMVVAERQADDLLNVRINQALDIVNKYIEERYPEIPVHKPESANVSGT